MQAPIAVYTSGKGSSAAGLTATVIKDANGEFYLEVLPHQKYELLLLTSPPTGKMQCQAE